MEKLPHEYNSSLEQLNNDISNIIDDIKQANLKAFFLKIFDLVNKHRSKSPLISDLEKDLIILNGRFSWLSKDYENGILSLNDVLIPRTKILSACLNSTDLIKRQIIAFYQNNLQNETEIEINLNKDYNENVAENESINTKKLLEEKLQTKIESIYTKEGSIKLGFKIPYNLVLMKKLVRIVNNLPINDFVSLKFKDPLIQSYLDDNHNLDDFFQNHFKKESDLLSNILSDRVEYNNEVRKFITDSTITDYSKNYLIEKLNKHISSETKSFVLPGFPVLAPVTNSASLSASLSTAEKGYEQINSIIVGDELYQIKTLEYMLNLHCPNVKVINTFQSSNEAFNHISSNQKPDLLFLDIDMPYINGLELLRKLDYKKYNVIFTSAHKKHMIDALRLNAIDYLIEKLNN